MNTDERTLSIALMLAYVHAGDGDRLGDAARELIRILRDMGIEPSKGFDD